MNIEQITELIREKSLVFVYGTLKRGYGNNVLLQDADFIGEAKTVSPWKLDARGGIPFLHKDSTVGARCVRGEVFAVNEQELANLDRLEGHPDFYFRDEILVWLDDCVWTAYVYFLSDRGYRPDSNFKPAEEWNRPQKFERILT